MSEHLPPDDGFVIRSWRRYGMRRLYIDSDDGIKLGWFDELAGVAHPEVGVPPEVILAAVRWYREPYEDPGLPPEPSQDALRPAPRARLAPEKPPPHREPLPPPPTAVAQAETPVPIPGAGWDDAQAARGDVAFVRPAGLVPLIIESAAGETLSTGSLGTVGSSPLYPPPRPYEDLTTHVPGASLDARARRLRQTRPVSAFAARLLGAHSEERAWRVGAQGELLVARELDDLRLRDPRWVALHSITVGAGATDIDHLVVGPPGVFTLNSKHHPRARIWVAGNTFLVNGRRQPYLPKSRAEASRAQRLLAVACGFMPPVRGVIVTVGAESFTVKEQPTDVYVVNRRRLTGWLQAQPALLSPEQVGVVYEMARRSTTWQP